MTGDTPEALGRVNPRPWLDALTDGRVVCADVGKAGLLGSLSVPPTWAMTAPTVEPVPASPSTTSLDATGGQRGATFRQGLMATMNQSGPRTHEAETDDSANDETQAEGS
ncbi:PE/PPE C-terminal domain-containing protein [Mycobacterium sp. E2497]|uniref:PE/PPE C-terminal domain-containing protein n=1 Tax=Mycobacterium sp. E2497 TaxID=1834135 RepID=UPI0009EE635F